MDKKRKKYTWYLVGGAVLVLLGGFLYSQRQSSLAKATSKRLEDLPRSGEAVTSDFYTGQLTEREKENYDFLAEEMENLRGGVVTLPRPSDGKEYIRVITALESEGYNHFYGLYDVPMTADDVYVKYSKKDILAVEDRSIEKVILFLSCAEGIDLDGEYGDDGKVLNLAEAEEKLSVNSEEKVSRIREFSEETEAVLDEIMKGLPADSGEKSTVDYFLNWLDENMVFAAEIPQDAAGITSMSEMFDSIYRYNQLSAAAKKRGSALGYAKILSELCCRAGMESHIVLGKWGHSMMTPESYVLCAVQMNGQTIYVDASGAKKAVLGGERYMTEKEAFNHMKPVGYFAY